MAKLIADEAWPDRAYAHCWDADGHGCFYGLQYGDGEWDFACIASGIDMPDGHDCGSPIMRSGVE